MKRERDLGDTISDSFASSRRLRRPQKRSACQIWRQWEELNLITKERRNQNVIHDDL